MLMCEPKRLNAHFYDIVSNVIYQNMAICDIIYLAHFRVMIVSSMYRVIAHYCTLSIGVPLFQNSITNRKLLGINLEMYLTCFGNTATQFPLSWWPNPNIQTHNNPEKHDYISVCNKIRSLQDWKVSVWLLFW